MFILLAAGHHQTQTLHKSPQLAAPAPAAAPTNTGNPGLSFGGTSPPARSLGRWKVPPTGLRADPPLRPGPAAGIESGLVRCCYPQDWVLMGELVTRRLSELRGNAAAAM